jgi:thiol-disulfide isomerase/thioredoxin
VYGKARRGAQWPSEAGDGTIARMRRVAVLGVLLAACSGGSSTARPGPESRPSAEGKPAAGGGASAPTAAIQGERGQIALENAAGDKVMLAAYGKPVTVIALWATFCHPCLEELPYVEALYQKHQDDDVAVIAVNIDDRSDPKMRAKVAKLEGDLGLTLPRLYAGAPLMNVLSPPDADGTQRVILPLLAVVDAAFRVHQRLGFERGETVDRYLADKEALIAAARRGDEPVAPRRPPPPAAAAAGKTFRLKIPKLSPKQLAGFTAQFRAEMSTLFPHIDPATLDELTARAEATAKTGGTVEIDLAKLAKPAP